MAYRCYSCGKKAAAGKNVSHAHKATNRRFVPNLQSVRIKIGNTISKQYVCTVCLKSGRVRKAL